LSYSPKVFALQKPPRWQSFVNKAREAQTKKPKTPDLIIAPATSALGLSRCESPAACH